MEQRARGRGFSTLREAGRIDGNKAGSIWNALVFYVRGLRLFGWAFSATSHTHTRRGNTRIRRGSNGHVRALLEEPENAAFYNIFNVGWTLDVADAASHEECEISLNREDARYSILKIATA